MGGSVAMRISALSMPGGAFSVEEPEREWERGGEEEEEGEGDCLGAEPRVPIDQRR